MEESLKRALHSDDKETLRARLILLQREYNRTVQRLKRAERSEAARKHVRSKIAAHNSLQQEKPTTFFSPSLPAEQTLNSSNQGDSKVCHKGTIVRFSLPSGILSSGTSNGVSGSISSSSCLCDNTPSCSLTGQSGNQVPSEGQRRHSAHRLRSRKSWQRWEQRERTDSQKSENGQDLTEHGEGERVSSSAVQVSPGVCQVEALPDNTKEVYSGTSLGKEDKGLALDKPSTASLSTDEELIDNHGKGRCNSFADLQVVVPSLLSERPDMINSSSEEQPTLSPFRLTGGNLGQLDEHVLLEGGGFSKESQAQNGNLPQPCTESTEAGCLSSCTVVEGLLFPVEYYIRTTRRMAAAQSRVDLEAVIQSQLSNGRRGKGQRNRPGGSLSHSSQSSDTSSLSKTHLTKRGDSQAPLKPKSFHTEWSSAPYLQPDICSAKSHVGTRRRGRGRSQRQRRGFSVQSSPSLYSIAPEPLKADGSPLSNRESFAVTPEKELYPFFCSNKQMVKSCTVVHCSNSNSQGGKKDELQARNCSSTGSNTCESLLLQPPGPTLLFSQVFNLKRRDFKLSSLLSLLDIKDFHLPDDEFGRLKLDKLQSSAKVGLHAFEPHRASYVTRWRASRATLEFKSSEEPVRSLYSTDCQPFVPVTSTEETTGLLNGAGLVNKTTDVRHTAAVDNWKAVVPEGGNATYGLSQEKASKSESAVSSSPTIPPNHNSSELGLVEDRMHSQVMGIDEGNIRETTDHALMDMGAESSPRRRHSVVATMAPSPCMLNLSPTPIFPCPKNDDPALPLWGSPTFPSLGVTPAFPLHPSLPSHNCSPSASPKAPSQLPQSTTPSAVHGAKTQRAVTERPVGDLSPSVPFHTSFMEIQDESFKATSVDLEETGFNTSASSTEGHSSTTKSNLHTSVELSDSLSASILDGLNSQLPSLTLSSYSEHPLIELPAQGCSATPSQVQEKVGERGQLCQSSTLEPTSLPLPCFSQIQENIDSVKHSLTASISPPHKSVQNFAEAEENSPGPLEKSSEAGCGLNVHSIEPQKDETLVEGSVACLDCQLTNGSDGGERDLDCYFTDSVWPLVTQMTPPRRQSSPCQDFTVAPLEVHPERSHEVPREHLAEILQLENSLKAPAGQSLVDVCGVYVEQGWCVVTAGEWEVSVWQESSSQHWSLLHTWTFTEHPVISLLPVPDAPNLVCVAFGQLEIREARVLSFVSAEGPFSQLVLCSGEVQAVLGVSDSRLASCTTTGYMQSVNVSCLTKDGRLEDSVCLISPGHCVQALAVVEGQRDALIGLTDSSHLVIWNIRTGHLLQTCALADSFPGTVCLRGYTLGGVLFVLLQHKLLSQEDGLLFSLVAVNPVTGRHVLVKSLSQPAQCSGRFLDSDAWGLSVVAVFQSGAVAVWDLKDSSLAAHLTLGAEEQCHIVRWSGPRTLLTGHLNGDVSVYQYRGTACS